MAEQLDLFPETKPQPPGKQLDQRIRTYIAMWTANPSLANLSALKNLIDQRMAQAHTMGNG